MESSPLRINLVLGHQIPFPPVQGGGVNNLLWMLGKEFRVRGHHVTVYSPSATGLPEQETDDYGIEHVRLSGSAMHPNVWINNLKALPYSVRLLPLLRGADITSFHTPFSFLLRYRPGLGACTHTIHRTPKWFVGLFRCLDRIYAGSDAVAEQACAIAPRLRSKLKTVHNCIDLPDHPPEPVAIEQVIFLYVGRFVPDKGLESLIRGFLSAASRIESIHLRIIGPQTAKEGADEQFFRRMKTLVAESPRAAQVSLRPSIFARDELFAEVRRSSVVCLPALSGETFSMAALEGMSCAKPLLVSDFGPMRELVEHEVNGCIVKAGDAGAWAEAITFLSAHRERILEMGARAFQKARASFSVPQIAQEYLEDFRLLAARTQAKHRRFAAR